jgi:probable poly-beta-1,6-N-acetyl-D-glucosamine export protein
MSWELSNLLRAIATTVVIWIHASYSWWFATNDNLSISTISLEVFVNTFINQAGRFTVPLFVIISGFGLAKSEYKYGFQLGEFVRKRCFKILPSYVFFTVVNLAMRSEFQTATLSGKFQQFLKVIADGSADYQLYFLLIILKCYVCYPLLRRFRFSPQRLAIVLVVLFSLLFIYWVQPLASHFGTKSPDFSRIEPMIFWLPYFLIGIWVAREPKWTDSLIKRLSIAQWGLVWAIAAILAVGEFYVSASMLGSAIAAGHFYRPTVALLSLTFLLWAMSWEPWIAAKLRSFQKFMPAKILATFSGASFTTFLTHTHVLRLLTPLEFLGGIPYLIITAIGSWTVGILLWKVVKYLQAFRVPLRQ